MDKNARAKIGKFLIGVLAVILVSLLSIVSTIAYLSDEDGEEVHTFTLGEGVDIELIQDTAEPEEFYPEKEYPEKAASVEIPITAMEYEYVGVKVQFFTELETAINSQQALIFNQTAYSDFSQHYGKLISYSESGTVLNQTSGTLDSETRNGWVEYVDASSNQSRDSEKGTIYLWCGDGDTLAKVKHGSKLMIFDSIRINKDCDQKYPVSVPIGSEILLYNQDGTLYTKRVIGDGQLKGFRIVVTAYAVQGDIDAADAKTALVSLIENN